MKSKRLTSLIAVLVISLLTCAATFGITAVSAEETTTSTFETYFDLDGASASVSGGNVVLTLDAGETTATVTSKYDFYLGALKIKYTATNAGIVINSNEYVSDTVVGKDAGKLKFQIKATEGATTASVTLVGFYYTDGNYLYTVNGEAIEAVKANAYVGDIRFADLVILGYNYESISVVAYHGFVKDALVKKYAVEADESLTAPSAQADVKASGTNYKFVSAADKTVKIFWGIVEDEAWVAYKSKTVEVTKSLPDDANAPKYTADLANFFNGTADYDYEDYQADILNEVKDGSEWKYIGSSSYFVVPTAIYKYIESEYFANDDLTKVIYYKLPESDSFSKLSSTSTTKRFALTKVGEYEFYVIATDPLNNALEIDEDWTLKTVDGVKGYYNDADELQVPVFTFYLGNRGPQVTRSSSSLANGYVNVSYTKLSTFTTKGNDLVTNYSLYYLDSAYTATIDDGYDAELNNAITADGSKWIEISDEDVFNNADLGDATYTDLAWNSSTLSFTPVKAGTYVVKCTVIDGTAKQSYTFSAPVQVNGGIVKADLEVVRVWFENNWLSVLFLSIAVLSLAGIIVLFFVKPKEEKELEELDN